MLFGTKIVSATYDILRGINANVWGSVKKVHKVKKILKTGIFGADIVIETNRVT